MKIGGIYRQFGDLAAPIIYLPSHDVEILVFSGFDFSQFGYGDEYILECCDESSVLRQALNTDDCWTDVDRHMSCQFLLPLFRRCHLGYLWLRRPIVARI